jgi:Ca2+-binding RTX toxin-like protein
VLWGRNANDLLAGGASNDSLYGEAGTDTLQGGNGNDNLIGGDGADTLDGGVGTDAANYAESLAAVTVNLAAGGSVEPGAGTGGAAAGDTLLSVESVVGSAASDTITGYTGANGLWGMDGNDVLTGGGGADAFLYNTIADSSVAGSGRDSINDFSHAEGDKIDLSAIDADGNAGNGDTAFTGAGHELRVVAVTGGQMVLADVNGDKVADMQINVVSAAALVSGDFVL